MSDVQIKRGLILLPDLLSVTLSGFKPETFSSVVRCSIQLSYKAIPYWECKSSNNF